MNYNEMLYNLRNFEYSLIEMNTKDFSILEIDLILQKAKAYIHATEFLDKEYNRRINEFYEVYKKDEYTNNYQKAYEDIKSFSIKKAKLNNRTIKYVQAYSEENSYEPYNVDVYNNKNQHRYFTDYPQIYYYPSLKASYANLSGKLFDADDIKELKITSSLTTFYCAFRHDKDFMNDVDIILPKHLAFFITLGNIKASNIYTDSARFIFDACAMCEVLRKLQDYVENESSDKWLINPPSSPVELPKELQEAPKQEKDVYIKFYENPQSTVKDIADIMKISPSRLNDIINLICKNLKIDNGIKSLRIYINSAKNTQTK